MKGLLLVICFFSTVSTFGQRLRRDTLVFECSPAMSDWHTGLSYAVQGKINWRFGRFCSMSARHNQTLFDIYAASPDKFNPNPYGKSSLSEFSFGLMILGKGLYHESLYNIPGLGRKKRSFETFIDGGVSYYKFAAYRTEYYTYDTLPTSEHQIICSINRFSAFFGLSEVIRTFSDSRLLRQHTFSAGLYHGINYDLQGFIAIEGQNPSTVPPKIYGYRKDGYYLRYNFRQQLNYHLYVGCELSFHRLPYVQYRPNAALFVFRGGESEWPFQPYAGLTVGWRI